MTLQEILKAIGLSEEQINKIMGDMKANKIFTASEENLDTRYGKLKTDHDSVTNRLAEANKLIEELKKGTSGNEALQEKIGEYETTIATLQKQLKQEKLDSAVKIALLESNCKDVDYITFKLKEKGELSLDDSGKVKGMEDKLAALKTQFPDQFVSGDGEKVDENRLPPSDGNRAGEPKTLAEALKMQYESKE